MKWLKKHLKYLSYVLRHKWYVFLACENFADNSCSLGTSVRLLWRGLVHDLSKFRPSEWRAYANFFYGKEKQIRRDKTGYYKPTDTGDQAFDFAWLLHQKRNKHHWQWWCLPQDEGGLKVLEMTELDCIEMVCDWAGASRAQGKKSGSVVEWYTANGPKMSLGPRTRACIEALICRV